MTLEIPPPSSVLRRSQPPATIADWLAVPAEKRAELIHGRIVYHAMPGAAHGAVQAQVGAAIVPEYHRRSGGTERQGGWWISQEVDLEIGGIGCRPDLVGWLRSEHPKMPKPDARGVVTAAPAWICEVLSASTASTDLGVKRDAYHRAGVAWYWIADPANRTLTALKRADEGYVIVSVGGWGMRVRVAPFEAVEIDLSEVFDDGEEFPSRG